jgi:multidrug efflux system outer membrane protein
MKAEGLRMKYEPGLNAGRVYARGFLGMVLLVGLAGCMVGPSYWRPTVDTPSGFRRSATDTNVTVGARSLADLGWWEAFNDPQLTDYLAEALTNSYDIKIAAARVLQAEAALRITKSQLLPSVNAGGDIYTARSSERGPVPIPPGVNPQQKFGDVFVSMPAYEVDLWGRLRHATDSARAQLLASVDAQEAVRQTLVATVATAYLELLELDLELDISTNTLRARMYSLDLTRSREEGGVASMQDVYQAQILVSTAEATIADTHRRIEQQEDLFCILLGRNPGGLKRGAPMVSHSTRTDVPAGLPSTLMERRPDIRAAEQRLISANADIGQAKAAFYPQVTLTGFYGNQSVALSDLFTGPARAWQFGPTITLPLFTGGRLKGNLKLAQARHDEAVSSYRQTVQEAFREVSDGLIAYQRTREFRQRQQERTQAHRDATEMANVRYEGGVTSYLEVLYNEQELFNAELGLAQARRNEQLSVVQLYQALGGGWTETADQIAAGPHPKEQKAAREEANAAPFSKK